MSERIHLEGECLCGGARYQVSGEAQAMFLCHCSRCRKESGSIHGATIFLREGELTWARGAELVREYALPGTRKARAFCSTCGCPLPRMAGTHVVLQAGGVETELPFEPTAHIFYASRAPWEDALGVLVRHPELPG